MGRDSSCATPRTRRTQRCSKGFGVVSICSKCSCFWRWNSRPDTALVGCIIRNFNQQRGHAIAGKLFLLLGISMIYICVNASFVQVCAVLWSRRDKELLSSHGFSDNQLVLWRSRFLNHITQYVFMLSVNFVPMQVLLPSTNC
jgi:hypothetical protein